MSKLDDRTQSFLNSLPFFKGLSEPDVTGFIDMAEIRTVSKGETLFLSGDPAAFFYVILSGWIKLYRSTIEGEEAVLAIFTRGDVFGEAAIFANAVYPFSADVAENARLMQIPASYLRKMAQANPDILSRILTSMSREVEKLQIEKEHLALMTAPQRVGCLLLQLSSGMMGRGGTFSFPYDKSLAAARLGMKPETFSRALAQLKPYGVQVQGSEIKIENFKTIVDFVCGHCSLIDAECRGSFRECQEKCHSIKCTKSTQA